MGAIMETGKIILMDQKPDNKFEFSDLDPSVILCEPDMDLDIATDLFIECSRQALIEFYKEEGNFPL